MRSADRQAACQRFRRGVLPRFASERLQLIIRQVNDALAHVKNITSPS
jgi:hypothetical protein